MENDIGSDAYLTLFALSVGDGITVVPDPAGGLRAVVDVTDGRGRVVRRCAIDPTVFDRLEERHLIEHVGDTVAITGGGRLWVKRWAKTAFRGQEKKTVLGVLG